MAASDSTLSNLSHEDRSFAPSDARETVVVFVSNRKGTPTRSSAASASCAPAIGSRPGQRHRGVVHPGR